MAPYLETFADGALTLVGASRRSGLPYHAIVYALRSGHLHAERRGRRVAIETKALDAYVSAKH